MERDDIGQTVRNVFGWETTRDTFSRDNLEEVLKGLQSAFEETPESIRNIFGWETLKGTAKHYYTYINKTAKHAVAFAKGAFQKENLPFAIAEASGYVGSYSLAIGWIALAKYLHCPDSVISVSSVLAKDILFWLVNTTSYKIGHEIFLPHKPYPEHYLKTLIKGNVWATLSKIPFQIGLTYLLIRQNHLPLWESFIIGQTAGLVPAVIRWTIDYRGHIWRSKPKYQDPPAQLPQSQSPPTNTLPS